MEAVIFIYGTGNGKFVKHRNLKHCCILTKRNMFKSACRQKQCRRTQNKISNVVFGSAINIKLKAGFRYPAFCFVLGRSRGCLNQYPSVVLQRKFS